MQARLNPNRLVRWQQTGASGGRSGAGKLLFYTITGAGVTAVGTIAYASRDPEFKSTINDYVPGFSTVTDTVVGQWRNIIGTQQNSEKVELVYKAERKDSSMPSLSKPSAAGTTDERKVNEKKQVAASSEITFPQPSKLATSSDMTGVIQIPTAEPKSTLVEPVGIPRVESTLTESVEATGPESTVNEPVGAPEPESVEVVTNKVAHIEPEILQPEEKTPIQV